VNKGRGTPLASSSTCMWAVFKKLVLIVVLLLLCSDLFTGERFRNLGDRTHLTMWYKLADAVDMMREKTGSIFDHIEGITTEKVDGWRNVAKTQS
jgi:hypothetical protein